MVTFAYLFTVNLKLRENQGTLTKMFFIFIIKKKIPFEKVSYGHINFLMAEFAVQCYKPTINNEIVVSKNNFSKTQSKVFENK